jgi:pimeloyl-ACP methyl ester carboxylesterase
MPSRDKKRPTKCHFGYWIRLIGVGLVGGLILAFMIIEGFFVMALTQPVPSTIGSPPQFNDEKEYLPVTFLSGPENIPLSGWYLPPKNEAVIILLHGYGDNRTGVLPQADLLIRHGYGVLLYDLRAHGESGGKLRSFGWQDLNDVKAALDYLIELEETDPDKIGILGFSIGGQIAIRAAANYKDIQAVIADDPSFVTMQDTPKPENMAGQLTHLISRITSRCISLRTGYPIPPGIPDQIGDISPRPLLLIASGESAGRDQIRYYYQQAEQPKQLWEIPEAGHGQQLTARPQEYEEKVISFFDQYLLDQ